MSKSIPLTIPLHIRLASSCLSIVGYWMTFVYFPANMLLLGLLLWTWFVLRGLFYSPEITIHANGIETRRLFWRHFTSWDELAHVRFGELNSQIYPATLHPLVSALVYNNLLVMAWRENYKEAMALIKEQLAERESRSQRAYE
jgi:hypothetical protein